MEFLDAFLAHLSIGVNEAVTLSNLWYCFVGVFLGCLVGLILGVIGTDVAGGIVRFGFDVPKLSDGLGLISIAMGLFAVAEVVKSAGSSRVSGAGRWSRTCGDGPSPPRRRYAQRDAAASLY